MSQHTRKLCFRLSVCVAIRLSLRLGYCTKEWSFWWVLRRVTVRVRFRVCCAAREENQHTHANISSTHAIAQLSTFIIRVFQFATTIHLHFQLIAVTACSNANSSFMN